MAKLNGVWTDNGILLLEKGELNRKRKYAFFSYAKQANGKAEDGEIVAFVPWTKEGKDVAIDVIPTRTFHQERKKSP